MTTLTPATTEDLAAALREATAHGHTIRPTGGCTKPWGNPVTTAVEISTQHLTGVREHSWGDLTATVAAGTSWQHMQDTLAQHGQRVALDPLFPERATVGGVLATNDSGLLRFRYGSLRDLVLGMTIVLADGTIARTGGKVVKNVAGYDLPKLLTGSFGTLGIITEATFRLHALAQHTLGFTVRSTEIAALAELMTTILKAGLSVERMQLRTESLTFALDVELASVPQALAEQEACLREFARTLHAEAATIDVFRARQQLFHPADATVLKITALPSKLAAIISGVAQLNQLPDHEASCVADPVGIVTVRLHASAENEANTVDDLRSRLAASGGTVTVLRRAALPATVDTWGSPPPSISVMRAIKHEFDPARLLNPGIFVGGI